MDKERLEEGKNEPVKNVDLWKRLLAAASPHKITFIWVKGHNGTRKMKGVTSLQPLLQTGKTF